MLSRKTFAIPYALFLLSFVVTPLVLIVIYSFTTPDFKLTLENYGTIFTAEKICSSVIFLLMTFRSLSLPASTAKVEFFCPVKTRVFITSGVIASTLNEEKFISIFGFSRALSYNTIKVRKRYGSYTD